jgi:hypothetical protein
MRARSSFGPSEVKVSIIISKSTLFLGLSHASIQRFDEVQLMWYIGGGADLQAARFGTSQPAKSRIMKDDMRRVGKYFGINNVTR